MIITGITANGSYGLSILDNAYIELENGEVESTVEITVELDDNEIVVLEETFTDGKVKLGSSIKTAIEAEIENTTNVISISAQGVNNTNLQASVSFNYGVSSISFNNLSNTISADIQDLNIQSGTGIEKIKIKVRDVPGTKDIYEVVIGVLDGVATFQGLRELIEEYMLNEHITIRNFQITISDADDSSVYETNSFYVLFSRDKHSISYSSLISNFFLIEGVYKTTFIDAKETIYWISTGGSDQVKWQINYVTSAGVAAYATFYTGSGSHSANALVSDDVSYADALAALNVSGATIRAYTVSVQNRYFTFFVNQRASNGFAFLFRNGFGCWQTGILKAGKTHIVEVSQSEAQMNGNKSIYNKSAENSWKIESQKLQKHEREWLREMILSNEVRIHDFNIPIAHAANMEEIIIIGSKFEENDFEESSVSFEWQYKDGRNHRVHETQLEAFNVNYDSQFS